MEKLTEDQRKAFKQVKVFTTKSEYFGIPSKIFYNIIAFSVGLAVALGQPMVAAIFLAVLGIPAYQIHKKDPDALEVWLKALTRRYNRWCAGRAENRKLCILKKGED
jgi:type IV secretory pathway VirB3-like protein